MIWAELIEALRARIAAAEDGLDVRTGGDAQVPEQRQVQLLRGTMTPRPGYADTGEHDQDVYIECWEHDRDPALANERLEDLEQLAAARVLEREPRLLPDWDTIVSLTGVQADNDAFRPSVGSRITVRVLARRKSNFD